MKMISYWTDTFLHGLLWRIWQVSVKFAESCNSTKDLI